MRPRDNEDKHQTRRTGGAKQTCNRQKLDSRIKESEVVEHCPGILKKLSPIPSWSHYSGKQQENPLCQKRIKRSVYPQGLESTMSSGIGRKHATYVDMGKDIRPEKNEVKPSNNKWGRSKSEVGGLEYLTGPLNVDDTGSKQESETKRINHFSCVSEKEYIFDKQTTSTPPSLTISTPAAVGSDMNLFNVRKYIEDLVEDQCWLVDKIIRLKAELNIILKTMEEVKDKGSLRGSASNVKANKSAQCRRSDRESLGSSNNCLQRSRLDLFGDNNNRGLSSPTLNIYEASRSVDIPDAANCDNNTDSSRDVTILTGHNGRQQVMSGTVALPHDISPGSEPACELCSATEQSMSCVLRLVQYVFLLALVVAQFIVQFLTMGM